MQEVHMEDQANSGQRVLLKSERRNICDREIVATWIEDYQKDIILKLCVNLNDPEGNIAFSVNQLLYLLIFCLKYNNKDILNDYEGLVSGIQTEVYVEIFETLVSFVLEKVEQQEVELPEEGVAQMKEDVEYLIQHLPMYTTYQY